MQHPGQTSHATSPGAFAPIAVAPSRPGWWQRNWKWAVPTGVVGIVGGFVAFIALIFACVVGVIRNCEVYETALLEARLEPAVAGAIGRPIEEGFGVSGNIEVNQRSGWADLAIPIEGPSGRATIFVEAEKEYGEWAYSTLEVAVHDTQETIDLLADR